jgi:GINS complex subunit 2
MNVDSLQYILELETVHFQDSFAPAPPPPPEEVKQTDYNGRPFTMTAPFIESCTENTSGTENAPATALPYHWYEMAEMLLDAASDDFTQPDQIRQLLRDIREVRLAKMRKGVEVLSGEGDGVRLDGVGAMELSESRAFIAGVIDGLRKIGASKEQARREREEEERENGRYGADEDEDEDDDMTI